MAVFVTPVAQQKTIALFNWRYICRKSVTVSMRQQQACTPASKPQLHPNKLAWAPRWTDCSWREVWTGEGGGGQLSDLLGPVKGPPLPAHLPWGNHHFGDRVVLWCLFPLFYHFPKFQEKSELPLFKEVSEKVKKVKVLFAQLCPALCDPTDCSSPCPSVEFSRQEYWGG